MRAEGRTRGAVQRARARGSRSKAGRGHTGGAGGESARQPPSSRPVLSLSAHAALAAPVGPRLPSALAQVHPAGPCALVACARAAALAAPARAPAPCLRPLPAPVPYARASPAPPEGERSPSLLRSRPNWGARLALPPPRPALAAPAGGARQTPRGGRGPHICARAAAARAHLCRRPVGPAVADALGQARDARAVGGVVARDADRREDPAQRRERHPDKGGGGRGGGTRTSRRARALCRAAPPVPARPSVLSAPPFRAASPRFPSTRPRAQNAPAARPPGGRFRVANARKGAVLGLARFSRFPFPGERGAASASQAAADPDPQRGLARACRRAEPPHRPTEHSKGHAPPPASRSPLRHSVGRSIRSVGRVNHQQTHPADQPSHTA